jgi:hypothetical protein
MMEIVTTEEKAIFRRRASWVAFSVLTLWIIGVRWHLRFEPLERDISTYAVIGRELLAGRPLYSDLWDHKPPAIHVLFAAATAVVGPGVPAVLLVNCGLSVAILGGLMVAGRHVAGFRGALLGGGLWALAGMDLGLQANQPNVELPMNLCVTWALVLSLGDSTRLTGRTGGVVTGLAILLKPVSAAQFGSLAVIEYWERAVKRKEKLVSCVTDQWIATIVLTVIAVMAWCVARAGIRPVWDAVIEFNLAYATGTLVGNILFLRDLSAHLPVLTIVVFGLLAAPAIVGLLTIDRRKSLRITAIVVGTGIAVAAPGRFYPHYYQLFLPSLIVAAAAGLAYGLKRSTAWRAGAVGILLMLALIEVSSLRLDPNEWSRRKYAEVFLDEHRVAAQLKKVLEPGEPFWQFGTMPGLYLLTGTVPASGVLYDGPLRQSSPIRDQVAAKVVTELTESAPRWILIRRDRDDRGVTEWLDENYQPSDAVIPVHRFSLWTRRDRQTPRPFSTPVFADGFENGSLAVWSRSTSP